MKAPLTDQQIVSLYQAGATESPSEELDKAILDYAKAQSNTRGQEKRRRHWPYMGLAASAVIVTMLAPWQWVDQTLSPTSEEVMISQPQEREVEEALDSADVDDISSAVEISTSKMKKNIEVSNKPSFASESRAERADSSILSEFAKEGKAVDDVFADVIDNPFSEVEALLSKGEKVQAQKRLQEILQASPELQQQLPDYLKELLKE